MGNVASCISLGAAASATVKVIHPDGTASHFSRHVRGAELMAAHPGHFVCAAEHLSVGGRVPGLAADAALEPCRACYFLLPMDMLYSVLTDEEMAALAYRAAGAAKRRRGGGRPRSGIVRIFPVLGEFCLFPADAVVRAREERVDDDGAEAGGAVRRQRSWQPALDTIEEAPAMEHLLV